MVKAVVKPPIKKAPVRTRIAVATRRVDAQSVWSLSQVGPVSNLHTVIGSYSTEVRAAKQAAAIIAKDAGLGLGYLRLPAWTLLPSGAKELIYGRDALSWRFVMEPWIVDGDA